MEKRENWLQMKIFLDHRAGILDASISMMLYSKVFLPNKIFKIYLLIIFTHVDYIPIRFTMPSLYATSSILNILHFYQKFERLLCVMDK